MLPHHYLTLQPPPTPPSPHWSTSESDLLVIRLLCYQIEKIQIPLFVMLGQNSVHCCPPGSERPPLWPLCNNRCPAFLFPTVSVRLWPVTDAVVRKMGSTDFLFLCMGPVKAGCESNWLLSPTDTGYCPPPTYPPELHDGIGTIVSPQPNNSKSNCVTLDVGNSHCDSSQRPSYLSCR